MKNEKGITLVALIITIIVLLILAVVTISAVNEGSLFSHANNAATSYSKAQDEENTMIANWLTELAKHDKNTNRTDIENKENEKLYNVIINEPSTINWGSLGFTDGLYAVAFEDENGVTCLLYVICDQNAFGAKFCPNYFEIDDEYEWGEGRTGWTDKQRYTCNNKPI